MTAANSRPAPPTHTSSRASFRSQAKSVSIMATTMRLARPAPRRRPVSLWDLLRCRRLDARHLADRRIPFLDAFGAAAFGPALEDALLQHLPRSEEHTSELKSLMSIS